MNIKKLNEELDSYLREDIEEENENAERKRKLRVYTKAYEALEELQEELDHDIDPATGKLDLETAEFYDRLTDIIDEIHSLSLAFEE